MSGFEKTAAEVLAGVPDTVTFAPSRMSNTATRLRALERFVIEQAVDAEMARRFPAGMVSREWDEVRLDIERQKKKRLAQLNDEEAIQWPSPGGG